MTDIQTVSIVDPGELMLEIAKNAEHITPEMQNAMAKFVSFWATPGIMRPIMVKVKDDE